jgi:hypothetical protein
VVYTNQFLYVYMPPFDAGGVLWYQIYRKCVGALVITQITLLGYFAIRQGVLQSSLCAPLPIITLFWANAVVNHYEKSSGLLSLSQATEMDSYESKLEDRNALDECSPVNFSGEDYVQPALKAVVKAEPQPYRDYGMMVDGQVYSKDTVWHSGGGGEDVVVNVVNEGAEVRPSDGGGLSSPLIPSSYSTFAE